MYRIKEVADNHPILFWLLVRLVISACFTLVVILGLLILVVAIAPLSGVSVGVWLLIPILVTTFWGCLSLARYLIDAFCDSW